VSKTCCMSAMPAIRHNRCCEGCDEGKNLHAQPHHMSLFVCFCLLVLCVLFLGGVMLLFAVIEAVHRRLALVLTLLLYFLSNDCFVLFLLFFFFFFDGEPSRNNSGWYRFTTKESTDNK